MDNSHASFPFNGQMPNMNMNEITGLMNQFSQLMEGNFMQSLQKMSQMQSFIPFMPGVPIKPMEPQTRGEHHSGTQSRTQPNTEQGSTDTSWTKSFNMNQLHTMMERLSNFLNNDLMRNMYNLQAHTPSYTNVSVSPRQMDPLKSIPIQLWENDQHMYLLVSIPGLKSSEDIKVEFVNDQKVHLRTKPPFYRPERKSRMILSEFPTGTLERVIDLPQPISTKSYSANYADGLFTLTLHKLDEEIEISVFDE